MSVQAINWVIQFEAKNTSEKAILLVLANYAGGDGRCYPGQQNIAKQACCSERTVRDALKCLEGRGVIRREERRRRDGSRSSDSIILVALYQPAESAGSEEAYRQILPNQPADSAGLTSFEPSEEPSDPLSETSSDAPAPKQKRKNEYTADFEAFWAKYPSDPNMSKKEAFDAWKRLDDCDRNACSASVPSFVAYCRQHPDYRPVHACRYIKYRRFDGFNATFGVHEPWPKRLAHARKQGTWSTEQWGPMPGREGCRVPGHLIRAGDGEEWREWERAP